MQNKQTQLLAQALTTAILDLVFLIGGMVLLSLAFNWYIGVGVGLLALYIKD